MRAVLTGIAVLFLTSPIDWPRLLITPEERWPKLPAPERYDEGDTSWHHWGKNFWTELMRADPEWWSKLARFIAWWLTFLYLVF